MAGLIGKKIGMTRIFDENGNIVSVSVVEAGPCYVTQIKTKETDGYDAVQLGYGPQKEKNMTNPVLGHLKKNNVPPVRRLREFPSFSRKEVKLGDTVTVEIFEPGEFVKVTGMSKGKGFSGVVKRHGFRGGPKTHGQSDRLRAPGSLGQSSYPSRVFRGVKMAGRSGNAKVSVTGLKVVKVDKDNNLLFIMGAVPGARNNYLEIHKG
jgi:large subunit ribosomal protein L3